jgi:ABC-type Fe3+/spermidine/putrescine transport system ATPase subunit
MSALDRRMRDRMALELREIQKRLGVTSIYVTHDQETASMISDRIIAMEAGRIVQVGTPIEIYRNPRSRFVADFIGDMNFIEADVVAKNVSGVTLLVGGKSFESSLLTAKFSTAERLTLALRPEEIKFSTSDHVHAIGKGTIVRSHFVNGSYIYVVCLEDGQQIISRTTQELGLALQSEVWLIADPAALRVISE